MQIMATIEKMLRARAMAGEFYLTITGGATVLIYAIIQLSEARVKTIGFVNNNNDKDIRPPAVG